MARGFASGWSGAPPTLLGTMAFRVVTFSAPDPEGSGWVDMLTHPHRKPDCAAAACAAGVATVTAGKDSSRCPYHGAEGNAC